MNEKAQKMRELLTKFDLKADELHNEFDAETLVMMGRGCQELFGLIKCEIAILDSVYVKAIAMDDLKKINRNLKTITSAIRFKTLRLEKFSLN